MNRRDFLKGFALLGLASATLLDSLEKQEEFDSVPLFVEARSWDGPPYLVEFRAQGNSDVPEWAYAGIRRVRGEELIQLALNTYGGLSSFIPHPANQIFIPPGFEIEVWRSSPHILAAAIVRMPGIAHYKLLEAV